jgi:uncharacterized protein (TIGR02001 family)
MLCFQCLTQKLFPFGEIKMIRSLLSTAFVTSLVAAAPALVQAQTKAPEPDYTLTGNISLVTDYRYRGISQSRLKPALQGTIDFAHKSGFYLGAFATNIKWIKDGGGDANVEIDLYGGYKGNISGDFGYDVGLLQYVYPNNNLTPSANTLEGYAGLTYKEYSLKYYRSFSTLFAFPRSRGSGYLDASATFDLGSGWGITGHIGHQSVSGNSFFSYTDYKLGVTKDLSGFILGAAIVGTDTDKYLSPKLKNLGKAGIVLSVGKNF